MFGSCVVFNIHGICALSQTAFDPLQNHIVLHNGGKVTFISVKCNHCIRAGFPDLENGDKITSMNGFIYRKKLQLNK